MGNVSFYQGKLTDAQGYFEESLEIRRSIQTMRGVAECLIRLSVIMMLDGDFDTARRTLIEVMAMQEKIAAVPVKLELVMAMARWFMLWGNEPLAATYLGVILVHPKAEQELKIEARGLLTVMALSSTDSETLLNESRKLDLDMVLSRIGTFLAEND